MKKEIKLRVYEEQAPVVDQYGRTVILVDDKKCIITGQDGDYVVRINGLDRGAINLRFNLNDIIGSIADYVVDALSDNFTEDDVEEI